jgi:serine/threonine protein kinase
MPLNIGQILHGRYRIDASLGQGGMASVYRGWDNNLSMAVAVKEMWVQPGLDPQLLAQLRGQFRQEAEVLARLSHPHLVSVIDHFEEGGNAYLIMRFVEGESLRQRIDRQGPVAEGEMVAMANQLLDALAYCHRHKIIHRDVKPDNLIIQPNGEVVLVDFGLVKLWDPNNPRTQTAVQGMGTPEYTPPEQYGGNLGHTDPRSDLYSVGATLYHALTGQAPPTATQRIAHPEILTPIRAIVPPVSRQTERTVLKAMALRQDERFADVTGMKEALAGRSRSPFTKRVAALPVWGWLVGVLLVIVAFGSGIAFGRGEDRGTGSASGAVAAAGTGTPSPTGTFTATASKTPTHTATFTPVFTIIPTDGPTVTRSDTPTIAPTSNPTPTSTPSTVRLEGIRTISHSLNNCGPATLTEVLEYYDSPLTQVQVASYLKPNEEDSSVSPWQIVDFVNNQTELQATFHSGGTVELLKRLLAAGFPVVIEKGYLEGGCDWCGQYLVLAGYNEVQQEFLVYDSHIGSFDDDSLRESYQELRNLWRHFNYTFYVVYRPDQEEQLFAILGPEMLDPIKMYEDAADIARAEIEANPNDPFAWHNLGTSLVEIAWLNGNQEYYDAAAESYDIALSLTNPGLPIRILWHQFGMYKAYLKTGRSEYVVTLTDTILSETGGRNVEESYYYRAWALIHLQRIDEAVTNLEMALERNPNFGPARLMLDSL